MKPFGPGLLFVGSFLITASISLGVRYLFRFSDCSWLVLEDCIFLGIYPFHPGCLIWWHIIVHNIFCNLLYFFVVSFYFSSFTSDFISLGPLSHFFLMSLVKSVWYLLNQSFSSVWFSYNFCHPGVMLKGGSTFSAGKCRQII